MKITKRHLKQMIKEQMEIGGGATTQDYLQRTGRRAGDLVHAEDIAQLKKSLNTLKAAEAVATQARQAGISALIEPAKVAWQALDQFLLTLEEYQGKS